MKMIKICLLRPLGWVCAALIIAAGGGCRGRTGPTPEAQAFWDRFLATNSAWLDPSPGPISYELALKGMAYDVNTSGYRWHDTGLLKSWCTPKKNLRIIQDFRPMPQASWRTNENRYFHGKGGKVRLKPLGALRNLSLDLWLAGRVGTGFLCPLHLCAAWGLPPDAEVREKGATNLSLVLTNARSRPHKWHHEMMVHPAYGLHPAVFATTTEVLAETVEVTIDPATLLPLRLIERSKDGEILSRITFEPAWVELGGRKVPSRIQCELPKYQREIEYEFAVEQGVWLLKEFTNLYKGAESLNTRATLRTLKPGPVADDWFPSPADLDIPEHSVTDCAPGERMVKVRTGDGLLLEGKLSLPPDARQPVAVVMFLPGAGVWTFDRPLVYPDLTQLDQMIPPTKVYNYCDFYGRQLSERGIGFFRMNKRGCGIVRDEEGHPHEICNRSMFSRATPSVLLEDYKAALRVLRQEPGVDPSRIVLLGASEGTRLAARLAVEMPEGIRAVVMLGYAGDNTRDTLVWQNTVGPWRNVAKIFDTDNDGKVTQTEYNVVAERAGKTLMLSLPFKQLDRDRNGRITPEDLNHRGHLNEILKAVRERNDDYLWDNLLQLSSAYLLEDWQTPPLYHTLLRLRLPLAIFHGEQDGACRVECVRETQQVLAKAGRTNLTVHIYPRTDHDLNWTKFLRDEEVPVAFKEVFKYVAEQCEPEHQ